MTTFNKYRLKGAYHYDWYKTEPWYKACVDYCANFCKGSTLDVGCGDGVLTNIIGRKYHTTGFDTDSDAIDLARQHTSSFSEFWLCQDSTDLKGRWDYLACLNVIEHLDNPGNIKRILEKNIRKGAIIMTLEWQGGAFGEDHRKEYTLEELTEFFKEFKAEPFRMRDHPEWIGVKILK